MQQIQFTLTATYQENVTAPDGTVILRVLTATIPVQINLPTTTTFTFGPPVNVVSKEVATVVIMRLAGDRTSFDSIGFSESVANYLNISSWRIVMQGTFLRQDFSSQFLVQPGPTGEADQYQATNALASGVTDGSFSNSTGFQSTSMEQQNWDIQAVITDYTASNASAYLISLRTYVATFPSPAGIVPQLIAFSGNSSYIAISEVSNSTDGNFYVQDWNIVIIPVAGQCVLQGVVSVNFNFTGANPTTVTQLQFTLDSSSTCPSVVTPDSLTGTIFAYTDISLTTKTQNLRQTDTIFFQAKINNNKLPIQDSGLTITMIQVSNGNGPLNTLVSEGETNYTSLNYGSLSQGGSVIAWMVISPDAFPITGQFSVYTFSFSLAIAYQRKRDAPATQATVASNFVLQKFIAATPSATNSNPATSQSIPLYAAATTKLPSFGLLSAIILISLLLSV